MTDQSFEGTEVRVSAAMKRLADSHQPDVDRRWPTSHPMNGQDPGRSSSATRRWMLVAASAVVLISGLGAVVATQRNGGDPATDQTPVPTVEEERVDEAVPTTLPVEPVDSVPATVPAEELTGARFLVEAEEQDAEWIVPWADGFLVGGVDWTIEDEAEPPLNVRFTTDGASWEPVEMSMPPGIQIGGRVTSVGDRFVMADSLSTPDGGVVIRVASTTDLVNWTWQDFAMPFIRPMADQNELGSSWSSMRSFAANETGWVFEIVRISTDVTAVLPGDVQRDLDRLGYRVRSDDAGFTVAVWGADGSPPTPQSTYAYTWDEFGITPEQVPYMTGEIPVSQTWAATWDGEPTIADSVLPDGPTLASPEGFVRWNDQTWFSADGVTWTSSPLPDPTGTVMNAFSVEGGFVVLVQTRAGTSEAYRLDERGGNPRLIDIDGLPEQFITGFADRTSPGDATTAPSAAVLTAGSSGSSLTPVVVDQGGYRYIERPGRISVIDLATGEPVLAYPRERAPGEDTVVEGDSDTMIWTDPATETVLMRIPFEDLQAARAVLQQLDGPAVGDAESPDYRLLAGTDGEEFILEPLRSSAPVSDDSGDRITFATNGGVVLVRLGDEWIRYDPTP